MIKFFCAAMLAFLLAAASPAVAHENSSDSSALIQQVLPGVVAITAKTLAEPDSKNVNLATARAKESFGSGFIVDPSGYIATNRHVVDGAFDVIVTLADGRRLSGRVVGRGRKFDLALIKVSSSEPLKALKFGDSDALKMGESLVVVGNPYGLGISASAGIVSGLRRNLGMTQFDRFIQTDAAINHGNSGGPIFNMKGEVIGVSTALYTGGVVKGGSIGIGFAIPSNSAEHLLLPLRKYGYLRLGSFEVLAQELTSEIAAALGVRQTGVILAEVSRTGPAYNLLKTGDIVVALDGVPVKDVDHFYTVIASGIDKTFAVKIWRQGAFVTVNVKAGQWQEEQPSGEIGQMPSQQGAHSMHFGVDLAPLTPAIRAQFGLAPDIVGMVVTSVQPDTPGAAAGFSIGDVIERVQCSTYVQNSENTAMPSGEAAMEKFMAERAKTMSEWKQQGWPYVVALVRGMQGPRFVTMPLSDWAE